MIALWEGKLIDLGIEAQIYGLSRGTSQSKVSLKRNLLTKWPAGASILGYTWHIYTQIFSGFCLFFLHIASIVSEWYDIAIKKIKKMKEITKHAGTYW